MLRRGCLAVAAIAIACTSTATPTSSDEAQILEGSPSSESEDFVVRITRGEND